MNREQIFTFLLMHTWIVGSAACVYAVRNRSNQIAAFLCLFVAGALPLIGARIFPDSIAMVKWGASLSRGHLPVAAIACAVSVPWLLVMFAPVSGGTVGNRITLFAQRWVPIVFVFSFLLTIASFTALMLVAPPVEGSEVASAKQNVEVFDDGFEIKQIATLDLPGVCLAVNSKGKIFVASTIYSGGNGQEFGVISEIIPTDSGLAKVKTVAESILLWRVYGMTTRGDDLYVSRSGRMVRAKHGQITSEAVGCVTQLKDLNSDGEFDYFHDVVSGLPGSQAPDAQHQNNGLIFRPDGKLLICQGNHGSRKLSRQPWEGAVLEVSADFQEISVFAEGLRNPFSLTLGPDGELFVIDQDWGVEGDELDHIVRGGHYGHPYVVGMTEAEGFTKPLLVGAPEVNLVAIAYTQVGGLENSLLISDLIENKIWRARLSRDGKTFKSEPLEEFASVPTPVDMCVDEEGTIFVLSRSQSVYRIRLKESE